MARADAVKLVFAEVVLIKVGSLVTFIVKAKVTQNDGDTGGYTEQRRRDWMIDT